MFKTKGTISRGKILKVKLGNNPTSSASTYHLIPSIYSAVCISVWMLWTFMGASMASIILFYKRLAGVYVASNKILTRNLEKYSIAETFTLSIRFIHQNIRQLLTEALLYSVINTSVTLFLLFTFFIANERDDTGIQSYATFASFIFLAMLIPTILNIKTVKARFYGKYWGFKELLKLRDLTKINSISLVISALLIFIVGICVAVIMQLPAFTNEYSFGKYGSEGKAIPPIAYEPFTTNSVGYLLIIIAVTLFVSLICKGLITMAARDGLEKTWQTSARFFIKEWAILLISMVGGALIPNIFIGLAATAIAISKWLIPDDAIIIFSPVIIAIGAIGIFVGPAIGSILPATSIVIATEDPLRIKDWAFGNGVNAHDNEEY